MAGNAEVRALRTTVLMNVVEPSPSQDYAVQVLARDPSYVVPPDLVLEGLQATVLVFEEVKPSVPSQDYAVQVLARDPSWTYPSQDYSIQVLAEAPIDIRVNRVRLQVLSDSGIPVPVEGQFATWWIVT